MPDIPDQPVNPPPVRELDTDAVDKAGCSYSPLWEAITEATERMDDEIRGQGFDVYAPDDFTDFYDTLTSLEANYRPKKEKNRGRRNRTGTR